MHSAVTRSHLGLLHSSARGVEIFDCHQIVTKTCVKRAKTSELKKSGNRAIWRLAKGFSWILCQIAKRRFHFSRPPLSATQPPLRNSFGRCNLQPDLTAARFRSSGSCEPLALAIQPEGNGAAPDGEEAAIEDLVKHSGNNV